MKKIKMNMVYKITSEKNVKFDNLKIHCDPLFDRLSIRFENGRWLRIDMTNKTIWLQTGEIAK